MRNKKTSLVIILLLFSLMLIYADIADKLIQQNYVEMLRSNGSQRYIGTLYITNNQLSIMYESDAGYNPTIMAYNITDASIKLIIKYRWLGINDEIASRNDGKSPSYYYFVKIKQNEEDEIIYDCIPLENVLPDNFIFTNGIVNDDNVNMRENPSLDGQIITQANKNQTVFVTGLDQYVEIENMLDYWFQIKVENRDLWIFGYYIDFQKEIEL
jgi:uncharacterized protein YgiM (DUF1202 family)